MNIPNEVIKEIQAVGFRGLISDPTQVFFVANLSRSTLNAIGAKTEECFISKTSLKHIFDQRDSIGIIFEIPEIVSHPTKIADNSAKRPNSFILVKMNGKAKGAVVEITKTPDQNRVVSAFPIDKKTYKKLKDISGRTDVPPLNVSSVESEFPLLRNP